MCRATHSGKLEIQVVCLVESLEPILNRASILLSSPSFALTGARGAA